MVCVIMRERNTIERAHAMAGERLTKNRSRRTRIDEQCCRAVAYQDRVALAHVKEDYLRGMDDRLTHDSRHEGHDSNA